MKPKVFLRSSVIIKAGNTNLWGRLSTVDLLIKVARSVNEEK